MSDDNVSSIDHDILSDFKPKQSLLDLKKNPLLISILEGCDTLKQMMKEKKIPLESLSTAKGLLLMKTDKVRRSWNARDRLKLLSRFVVLRLCKAIEWFQPTEHIIKLHQGFERLLTPLLTSACLDVILVISNTVCAYSCTCITIMVCPEHYLDAVDWRASKPFTTTTQLKTPTVYVHGYLFKPL